MKTKRFREIAEGLGWSVTIDGNDIELSQYSPAGQDFSFSIRKDRNYIEQVYEYYNGYDPSEEAMLWVDDCGHGKNGAPHDLLDVLLDMKEIEKMLETLYTALINYKQ